MVVYQSLIQAAEMDEISTAGEFDLARSSNQPETNLSDMLASVMGRNTNSRDTQASHGLPVHNGPSTGSTAATSSPISMINVEDLWEF